MDNYLSIPVNIIEENIKEEEEIDFHLNQS